MFCGIGLCDGSPGLSLAGPVGEMIVEQPSEKPSHTPSQSLSLPSQMPQSGPVPVHACAALHAPHTPFAVSNVPSPLVSPQVCVPRHVPVPQLRISGAHWQVLPPPQSPSALQV